MTTELIARHGAIEGTTDKLVKDLRGVVDDTDHPLKEMANSTAAGLSAARANLGAKLAEARYRLDDARTAVTDKAKVVAHTTQEYVLDNPWKVLGIAAAVGLMIGVVISRR